MTVQPFPCPDQPNRPPDGARSDSEFVSLDELLALGACERIERSGARPKNREAADWLRSVEQITAKGWGPTLRASCLAVTVTILISGVLLAAGEVPAVCTTIALIIGRYGVRAIGTPQHA